MTAVDIMFDGRSLTFGSERGNRMYIAIKRITTG